MSILTPNLRVEFGITEELLEQLGRERYNDPEIFSKNEWNYHPKIVEAECEFEHMMILADMMGSCKFCTRCNHPVCGIHIPQWKDFLNSAIGESFGEEDLRNAVQRVLALERCYNAREGLRRMDDYPFYLWWQKKYGKPHPVYTGDKVPLTEKNTTRLWMHGT